LSCSRGSDVSTTAESDRSSCAKSVFSDDLDSTMSGSARGAGTMAIGFRDSPYMPPCQSSCSAPIIAPCSLPPGCWNTTRPSLRHMSERKPQQQVEKVMCPSVDQAAASGSHLRGRMRRGRGEVKLAECLEQLDKHDSGCILRITGLGKLGVEGASHLKCYFEAKYGQVNNILLANRPDARSILAFLVARDNESVSSALSGGQKHIVRSGTDAIQFKAFVRRAA